MEKNNTTPTDMGIIMPTSVAEAIFELATIGNCSRPSIEDDTIVLRGDFAFRETARNMRFDLLAMAEKKRGVFNNVASLGRYGIIGTFIDPIPSDDTEVTTLKIHLHKDM